MVHLMDKKPSDTLRKVATNLALPISPVSPTGRKLFMIKALEGAHHDLRSHIQGTLGAPIEVDEDFNLGNILMEFLFGGGPHVHFAGLAVDTSFIIEHVLEGFEQANVFPENSASLVRAHTSAFQPEKEYIHRLCQEAKLYQVYVVFGGDDTGWTYEDDEPQEKGTDLDLADEIASPVILKAKRKYEMSLSPEEKHLLQMFPH